MKQVLVKMSDEQYEKIFGVMDALRNAGCGTSRSDVMRIALELLTPESAVAHARAQARQKLAQVANAPQDASQVAK